jgi:Transmembrane protein 43
MTESGTEMVEGEKIVENDAADEMIDMEKGVGIAEGDSTNRDTTEVTTQSYGSKLKDSCSGACFGFVLFFVSITLLIWNEGRTVKRMKDIDEGRETVVEFDLNNFTNVSIPTAFDNQLIHAVGDLSTTDVLIDPLFGISSGNNATNFTASADSFLKMRRSVEMYQWKESSSSTTRKNADGSSYTETTYSYSKEWSKSLIDSSQFREKLSSRTNPGSFPFEPQSFVADPIYLGNTIELQESVVDALNWYESLDSISIDTVPDTTLRAQLSKHTSNGFFYSSNNLTNQSTSNQPNVGDARVTFDVVLPDVISIIAKLNPAATTGRTYSIGSFMTKRGGNLLLVERGLYTAEEMFTQADQENTTTAWILRCVGFLLMVFAILLILQPLATIVDIVPFVGDFIQSTMEGCLFPIIAVIIALPTCLFIVALAWLAYRPIIAIPIAVVSLLLMTYFFMRVRKNKLQQQQHNNDNDTNNEAQPEKIQEYNTNNYDVNVNPPYSPTHSPYNSTSHNNDDHTGGAEGGVGDGIDKFAESLDRPPPSLQTNNEPTDTKNNNAAVEEDVILK